MAWLGTLDFWLDSLSGIDVIQQQLHALQIFVISWWALVYNTWIHVLYPWQEMVSISVWNGSMEIDIPKPFYDLIQSISWGMRSILATADPVTARFYDVGS